MSAVSLSLRLPVLGVLGAPWLAGCLLVSNPAYEDTGDATTGTPDFDTTTGEPVFPCPDDQPFSLWYPDADADSYGDRDATPAMACEAPAGHVQDAGDCNDKSPEIRPKLPEQCNGFDDNCNALVDESSPNCGACVIELTDSFVYWVCAQPGGITRAEARQHCVARSTKENPVRLASIHSAEEHARLAELVGLHVPPVGGEQHAWIGLVKREEAALSCDPPDPVTAWRWDDGSDFNLDPPPWNWNEPNNSPQDCACDVAAGCVEDCGEIQVVPAQNLSGWNDFRCDATSATGFICKTHRDPVLFP
ncbi:MAG TPA: MopE-related protein [Nannocystis sp.]|jgi:hypothetical protein